MNPLLPLCLLSLLFAVLSLTEDTFSFFPMVQQVKLDGTNLQSHPLPNPCSLLFKLNTQVESYHHIQELLKHYQLKTFGCHLLNLVAAQTKELKLQNVQYVVDIEIKEPQLKSVFTKEEEEYHLNVTQKGASIKSKTYVGLVRAVETFYQALDCSSNKTIPCTFKYLPIQIVDSPQLQYRGLMIDTARHFLPITLILETIDALMYNKMNVLHWHITDDDSFSLEIKSHPELTESGAFSKESVYTQDEIKEIVRYAMVRGVRVIPEIPTPGRTQSWTKSTKFEELLQCKSDAIQVGGFNPESEKVFGLVKDVFKEVFELFSDPVVHLGGDPLAFYCLKKSQNEQKIIHQEYRKRQKEVLKSINANKTFMYWGDNTFVGDVDDIVHYNGNGPSILNNKIVVSNNNEDRLDTGVGGPKGDQVGYYSVWTAIYRQNIAKELGTNALLQKVMGRSAVLWSWTSNEYTHHVKIWARTCAMAERLWNSKGDQRGSRVLERITRHVRIMDRRGIPTAPVTCQQCEILAINCA